MIASVSGFYNRSGNTYLPVVLSNQDVSKLDSLNGSFIHYSNVTIPRQDQTYHYYGIPLVSLLCIIIVVVIIFTIVGNVMVILIIVRHKGMRTRTNMFLVNLAVADILVAILNMPVSLFTLMKGKWIFGDLFCKLNGFSMGTLLICSIHTLMYISIHKYISISRPFSHFMTPTRIFLMIVATWIWSIACGMSPLLGWNTIIYKKGASQCGPALPTNWIQYSHSIFITTTDYIIPLCVMSFCYFNIFREINQHMTRIRETSNIDLTNSIRQQKRITVTLVLVLACFLLCWTPFIIYSSAVSVLKDKSKMPLIVNPVAYLCGYINSACNPVIYALRSPSFRRGYQEIMCDYVQRETGRRKSKKQRRRTVSAKAISAPCSPSGKRNLIDRTSVGVPDKHRNKVLLSQTSWSSLPFLSLQTIKHEASDPSILSDKKINKALHFKGSKNRRIDEGSRFGISNHVTPSGDDRSQADSPANNCPSQRLLDSQNSSEASLMTLSASRTLNKKAYHSCYVSKSPKTSISNLIKSASVDNLDSLSENLSDSEQEFGTWSFNRLKITQKKKETAKSSELVAVGKDSVIIDCDKERESQL